MQNNLTDFQIKQAERDKRNKSVSAANWNQREAATYFGVSDATVNKWRTKIKEADRIPWHEAPTGGPTIPIAEAIRWHERWRRA